MIDPFVTFCGFAIYVLLCLFVNLCICDIEDFDNDHKLAISILWPIYLILWLIISLIKSINCLIGDILDHI